jgi:dUTP pyrophosphatase
MITDPEYLKNKLEELERLMNVELDDEDIDFTESFDDIYEEYGIDVNKLEKDMEEYHPKLRLGFTKLHQDTIDPTYAYESDSGFDLRSTEEITIPPFGRALVPTGLSFNIDDGFEIQVRSKSGLAINQGLMVLNSPGTVDNGYTGEVKAIIFNTNQEPFTITKGMKVAQAVLCPVINGKWVDLQEEETSANKDRNANGFGSTGI